MGNDSKIMGRLDMRQDRWYASSQVIGIMVKCDSVEELGDDAHFFM